MNWKFWTAAPRPRAALTELGGFRAGQLVQHKISRERMVIVALSEQDGDTKMSHGPVAHVTVGTSLSQEFDVYLAEIEPAQVETAA